MASQESNSGAPVYQFTPKHRWQVKLHLMSGITLGPWLRFLRRHYAHIDWGTYWHRVAFLSAMSVVNSLLAVPDWLLYSRRVRSQPLHPEPLFILGHPRTGTTHLHNLLALDPVFAYCNTFHAGFPSSFICLNPVRGLLSPLLEERRPMDNMALSWDLPAEDEIAVNTLTGGTSPYCCIVLPREAGRSLRPFYTFEFEPDRPSSWGLPAARLRARLEEWQGSFLTFMRKVTLWHSLSDRSSARSWAPEPATCPSNSGLRRPSATLPLSAAGIELGAGAETQGGRSATAGAGARAGEGVQQQSGVRNSKNVTTHPISVPSSTVSSAAPTPHVSICGLPDPKTPVLDPTLGSHLDPKTLAASLKLRSESNSSTEPKPLLIKSPVHTARIPLLLEMFPSARFVYIHRHPLQVFQSAAHMADTYYWYTYLHTPTNRQVTNLILDQYDLLYEKYMSGKALVPLGNLHELSFDQLEADPIGALRAIYTQFGWQDRFEPLVPRFTAYCATLSDFKKNQFNRLAPDMAEGVRRRWAPSFRQFDYE